MFVWEFDFQLPPELIAQEPRVSRTDARLLYLNRRSGTIAHTTVGSLPELLLSGDLLVVNDTRVFPARLIGHRVPSGGVVECLLLAPEVVEVPDDGDKPAAQTWEALVHPGQKLKPGAQVLFEGRPSLHAEVLARRFHGRRLVRLWTDDGSPVDDAVDAIGHVPLPPYIKRSDRETDRNRYQTVFARRRGSVAAPTAGLHFTNELMERLSASGIEMARITLHVGYGTFQPVHAERVEEHRLHPESYAITNETANAVNRALTEGRRVIAVGTTTTRTLEAVARINDGLVKAGSGVTDLFIYPGFRFRVVSGLLTNFHLPRSSLLMLVCALGGRDTVLAAYRVAVAERYRFYSYGDAMLVL